jgi:hypothetical protein
MDRIPKSTPVTPGMRQSTLISPFARNRTGPLLIVLLLTMLCCGCKTLTVLHKDPAFRASDLESGNLAIAAVAGLGSGEYYLAPRISAVVRESFKATYPNIQVYPLEDTKSKVSGVELEAFLSRFSKEEELREEDLTMFLPLRSQARYILLINIEDDDGSPMRRRAQRIQRRWGPNPETGRDEWIYFYRGGHRPPTGWMESTFFICDLQARQPVWIAVAGSGLPSDPGLSAQGPGDVTLSESALSSVDVMRTIATHFARKLPR